MGPVSQRQATASAAPIGEALELPIDAASGLGGVGGDGHGPPGADVALVQPGDLVGEKRWVRREQPAVVGVRIDRLRVTLQAMFASAVEADVIVRSPVRVRSLGLQPIVRRDRPTLAAEQLEALAAAVPDQYAALVLLAGVTGVRWGEAIGLRLADVDLLGRTVSVRQTVEEVSGHVKIVAATKTAASRRRFSIPMFLVERLSLHVAEHRPGAGPEDLLFIGANGGLLRRSFRARVFKPAVAAAGLPDDLTFHGLRHVAASLLVVNGEHPKVIQARLGHADPAVSLGIYAHVSDELDRAVGDRLGALFDKSADPTPEKGAN